MNGPWALFGLALSAALVICTPFVWRARGAVVGLRWLAVAIVPGGLAITGLFTLVARISTAVTGFFAGTISPLVWTGYALLGLAVLIWVVAGLISSRRASRAPAAPESARGAGKAASPAAVGRSPASIGGTSTGAPAAAADDEFADIEAILRRRGI